jgi:hypothetical protein
MQTEIYKKVLGQVLRHFLQSVAVYLAVVGVDEQSHSELVTVTVNILVPVILTAVAQLWGLAQKRYESYMTRFAASAPHNTTVDEVHDIVTKTQSAILSI